MSNGNTDGLETSMSKKNSQSNVKRKNNSKDGLVIQSVSKMNSSRLSTKRKITNATSEAGDIIVQKIEKPSLPKISKMNSLTAVNECQKSSAAVGEESLKWMISPHKTKKFLNQNFEKNILHIKRDDKNYYRNIFSCKSFDKLLRNSDKPLIFGKVSASKKIYNQWKAKSLTWFAVD